MKSVFAKVIQRGSYDLNGLLKRIDEYHVSGKLSDTDREELIAAARGEAVPELDVVAEIQRLWAAIHDLEAHAAEIGGEIEGGVDEADVPEYAQPTGAHDAYYYGSIARYKDQLYMCIAPEGVACVWSPDVMPDYWQVM